MCFWGVVAITNSGHCDNGHPSHVGVGGAGRSRVDDVLGNAKAKGEHREGDEEDDCDEREGVVFEDGLEAKHHSRVGSVKLADPSRTRRHVPATHQHARPEVPQPKTG